MSCIIKIEGKIQSVLDPRAPWKIAEAVEPSASADALRAPLSG
jgi:hypothetical protein